MKRTVFLFTGLILSLNIVDALSTVMKQFSIKDLTQKSDLVITGKVLTVTSQWSLDNSTIYTYVEIESTSFVKGIPSQNVLKVRVLGGTMGRRTLVALGAPRFDKNEEVLVFLQLIPNNPSDLRVVGLAQGKFLIGEPGTDGMQKVTRDLSGIEFIGTKPSKFPATLKELVMEVKKHIK